MSRRRSQIWILLLSNSGRRALWDGFRKWENEREGINCVWMCVHEPLVCGRFDKRAAGQCWQVKPVLYNVTSLSERVIARWPGHLKIREAISPTLNSLSFSVYHPYFSFVICYSFPLFPNSSHSFQMSPSLSKSFLLQLLLCFFHPLLFPNPRDPSLTVCNFILHLPFRRTLLLFGCVFNHMWLHTDGYGKEQGDWSNHPLNDTLPFVLH